MNGDLRPMTPIPAPLARRLAVSERLGARPYLVGLWIAGGVAFLVVYANHDHLGYLDNPPVTARVAEACRTLTADLAGRSHVSTTDRSAVAEAVRSENRAVDAMVRSVEALGHDALAQDDPALGWLADWEAVIALRETYAADLVAGRAASVVLPLKDGIPISRRDPGARESSGSVSGRHTGGSARGWGGCDARGW